jgi:hypothetical protein
MKKVFTVAYRGCLTGIYTNRKLTWEGILKVFNTTEEELKSKGRTLTCEYVISGDWRRKNTCTFGMSRRLSSLPSLTSLFMKSSDLIIRDKDDFQEKVTVHMVYLNDTELPAINEDY